MNSGRDTLARIEEALHEVQREERRVQQEMEAATKERGELMDQRLEAYRSFAEVRARDAIADGVIDDADHLSAQVQALLKARAKDD